MLVNYVRTMQLISFVLYVQIGLSEYETCGKTAKCVRLEMHENANA